MARSHKIFGAPGQASMGISPTYRKADKANKEGFPAFKRTLEEDTLSVLLVNTLSNTFYVSAKDLAKETLDVLQAMAAKDPVFLGKALVYARTKGLMRLAPVIGLVVLSTVNSEEGKKAFRLAFPQVVRTPDDLREFVTFCRTKKIRKGLFGLAKTMVQNSLRHMSEYHGVKYGSAASEGITLRDVLRLAHPRPKTDKSGSGYERLKNGAQAEMFGWLVKGWDEIGNEPSPTNPMIWALEKLKRSESEAEIVSLVKTYRLPWEVVVPSVKKMTEAVWKVLLEDMPYMALLRNLNTMERHGVLKDAAVAQNVAKRLSDPKAVEKSKQFPFRFMNAFRAFTGPQAVRDGIAMALEQSFVNVPVIKGRTCVSNDISSSMGSLVSDKGETKLCEIAGLFAAALLKKCDDVMLLPFDDVVHPEIKVSKLDSVMSIAQTIGLTRGGTSLGAPIQYLTKTKEKVDTFIGITDNEDWAGRGFLTYLEEYRQKVNPAVKAVLITLAPYSDWVAPAGYPGVYFVQGWSDSVLRYIPMVLESDSGQVDAVRSLSLEAKEKAPSAAADVDAA